MAKHVSHPGYDKTRFRIMCHEDYDEYGDLQRTYFTIDEFKKGFFGRMKWQPLKHDEACWDEILSVLTTFKTRDQARAVIYKLENAEHINETKTYEVL